MAVFNLQNILLERLSCESDSFAWSHRSTTGHYTCQTNWM